jgi:uncharacterized membrane protein YbhN (UPF0104 family)
MFSCKSRTRGKQRLRALLNPKVLVVVVLGAVVIATLLTFSNAGQVWRIIEGFPLILIPILFALVVGRELFRSGEWRVFLSAIGIHASRRQAFLSLTAGDAAQVVPGGLYFQDLLISRELQASPSAALAATTAMIWMEVCVSMLTLALLGLPGIPVLRPLMAVGGVGALLALMVAHTRLLNWVRSLLCRWEHRLGNLGRKVIDILDSYLGAFAGLSDPRVLLSGLALCASYMALTYFGFYLVCAGLHLPGIGPAQAAAVYSLVLVIVIINPLPSDIGVSELSGVGGFLAFHVPAAAGLAAMLTFRILLLIGEEVVGGMAFLLFREEVRALLRPKVAVDK